MPSTYEIHLPVQSGKIGGSTAFIPIGAGIEGGSGVWKALFDASQTESMLWQFDVPDNFSTSQASPRVDFKFAMTTSTTGKVDPEFDIMAVADGEDPDTASFDTVNEITGGSSVLSTAGHIKSTSITLVNIDSMVAGELCVIRFSRDHDDADDNAGGDMELITAVFKYTS